MVKEYQGIQKAAMEQTLESMKTALRVLTSYTTCGKPDKADLERLYSLAGPELRHQSVDELACEVIHRVVDERAKGRLSLHAVEPTA